MDDCAKIDQAEAFAASTELPSYITNLSAAAVLLIAAFAIGVIVHFISRWVRPMNELSERLASMTVDDADLTNRVTEHGSPEIDRIASGFNQFRSCSKKLASGDIWQLVDEITAS